MEFQLPSVIDILYLRNLKCKKITFNPDPEVLGDSLK